MGLSHMVAKLSGEIGELLRYILRTGEPSRIHRIKLFPDILLSSLLFGLV